MGKVSESVLRLIEPIAAQLGLTVLEVEYAKKFDGMNLTVIIDKEGGVTINDCEALHRAIDAPLDELDPIDTAYTLNVSSPGLDRPLKLDWDYKRNLGKKIKVKLYKPMDGKKTFDGVLTKYDDETFAIDVGKTEITFVKKETAQVLPIIEF
ncbi:MAG: ribosome maturation factor RimP [Corallococcus sp.]|nr:ribosome maturation factor RimP [Corallococcus sp.]MCM1359728.1 ribosome maturation factor RimP [Corallococcus sp.]MCM1395437.1 ribosome maturation factor RimP [Corallococcus sp.]